MGDYEDSRKPLQVVFDAVSCGVVGVCVSSALFHGLNEIPSLQFVGVSFLGIVVMDIASFVFFKSPSGGDDQ